MATTGSLITPVGVLSFPHFFKPRSPAPGTDERYSGVLIFDETAQKSKEFKHLQMAVSDCAKEAFGENVNMKRLILPFKDAGEKSEYAGYEDGMITISAWSNSKPGLIDHQKQEILVPDDIWPGQLARFSVKPFPYNVSGNRGVSFALNNVQRVKMDMPRLDGRKAAQDEFDEMDDFEQDDDEEDIF